MLLVCDCLFAQDDETKESLHKLTVGSAQDIAAAISALPDSVLDQPETARQLTLLLNNKSAVVEQSFVRETVSDRAWFKLLDLPSTACVTILQEVPKLETDRSRSKAFEAVARIGKPDRRAYEMVLPYCKKDDVFMRSRAISALSAVADNSDETVYQFGKLLMDSHPLVKWTVLSALDERIEHIDPVIPDIVKVLDDHSDVQIAISDHFSLPEKLSGRAARLLAKIGPKASVGLAKLKTLTGPEYDKNVRIWSATAICKITGSPPQQALDLLGQLLLDDMDSEYVQNDAPDAIAQLGPAARSLLDTLERAKQHHAAQIRWELVDTFFALDSDSAVARCLPLMEDEDEAVSETVIEGFSRRGISEPRVIAAYMVALGKHDGIFEQPANAAVNALAKLGPAAKESLPALQALAHDPNISDTLRESAKDALQRIR